MRESRKQQIMEAALELFASEGYSHSSIARIAQHANISKGLIYNYFDSKEALLLELIDEGMQTIMNMIDPNQDGALNPEEVEGFIRRTFESIRENSQFWIFFISVVLQPGVRDFLEGKPFSSVLERFGPKLIDYFEMMGYEDPYLEMLTFSALIEGYGVVLVYYLPQEDIPERVIKKFEDRMVHMFTKKPNES